MEKLFIEDLDLKGKKVLVVLENLAGNEAKSFRNISNILLSSAGSVNTYSILIAEYVVFTKSSLNEFIRRLSSGRS